MSRSFIALAVLTAIVSLARPIAAQEIVPSPDPDPEPRPMGRPCADRLDPETVVRCALALSPEVREARQALAAIAGRRTTGGVWLPSNPVVGATVANRRRQAPDVSVLNWSVSLSQEIEIAGQRGGRLEVADAEAAAQARRVAVAEQEVGAGALAAFFEAVAAKEQLALAEMIAETGKALAVLAEGRAKESLMPGIEADVARAEAARIGLMRLEAQRRFVDGGTSLALLLGQRPEDMRLFALAEVSVPPLEAANESGLEQRALRLRGEIGAAEMERRVLESRLSLLKRERVPNLTVSAFAERGEIDDRIFGVGLSLPVPLPSPVGRTRAGEIVETLASIQVAESSLERVKRRVRLEVARAVSNYKARAAAGALFVGDLLPRARADLAALRDALSARQLTMREVVVWQRSLLELLQTEIESRLAVALAWVELRRVAGIPLTEGTP
jgi:cobalt-zinc-cadmium efflux system outer membrane protein